MEATIKVSKGSWCEAENTSIFIHNIIPKHVYPSPPTSAFSFLQIHSHDLHIWPASHNLGVCFNLELLWSARRVRVLYIKCANSSLVFYAVVRRHSIVNTLRPRQNGRHFPDDIFKCIFFMKMYEFRLRFHWSLFLGVQTTISQHWFW